MNSHEELLPQFNRLQKRSLVAGAAGIAALLAGLAVSSTQYDLLLLRTQLMGR